MASWPSAADRWTGGRVTSRVDCRESWTAVSSVPVEQCKSQRSEGVRTCPTSAPSAIAASAARQAAASSRPSAGSSDRAQTGHLGKSVVRGSRGRPVLPPCGRAGGVARPPVRMCTDRVRCRSGGRGRRWSPVPPADRTGYFFLVPGRIPASITDLTKGFVAVSNCSVSPSAGQAAAAPSSVSSSMWL